MRVLTPGPNKAKVRQVVGKFETLFPDLGAVRVKMAWGGLIDALPDIVPVADRVQTVPGVLVCTGMCGHGFGIGPAFGRIMADMVARRDPGHDLTRFRLGRFHDGSKLVLGPDI